MLYVLVVVIAAFVTAAMTKKFRQTRTRIGVVSLALAAVAVTIAEVTGNLALFYVGSLAVAYGVVILLIRVVDAAMDRGDRPLFRDK